VNRYWLMVTAMLLLCKVATAESRFGRPVIKLSNPKEFKYFKLDDNQFPMLERGPISVSCMTYRGTKSYYVEVAVDNQSESPITLDPNFVSFNKPGYSVFLTDTVSSAADVWASVAGPFIPTRPPPPTQATTTYSGTASTYGNTTQLSGTATTTVDDSAAGWHGLGQAIAARRYRNAQTRDQSFAVYLVTFAHEKQEGTIQPGKAGLYIFTFQQIKQKKAPFDVTVKVGSESFAFRYKE